MTAFWQAGFWQANFWKSGFWEGMGGGSAPVAGAAIDLELFETSRLNGSVTLYWNGVPGATSYTIQNQDADLRLNAASPATLTGLLISVAYRFKVVANLPGGAIQSREIDFEWGANEVGDVEANSSDNPGNNI